MQPCLAAELAGALKPVVGLQVIARVGRLTRLNGSDVSTSERRDAEVRYLRTRTGAKIMSALSCVKPEFVQNGQRARLSEARYYQGVAPRRTMPQCRWSQLCCVSTRTCNCAMVCAVVCR